MLTTVRLSFLHLDAFLNHQKLIPLRTNTSSIQYPRGHHTMTVCPSRYKYFFLRTPCPRTPVSLLFHVCHDFTTLRPTTGVLQGYPARPHLLYKLSVCRFLIPGEALTYGSHLSFAARSGGACRFAAVT